MSWNGLNLHEHKHRINAAIAKSYEPAQRDLAELVRTPMSIAATRIVWTIARLFEVNDTVRDSVRRVHAEIAAMTEEVLAAERSKWLPAVDLGGKGEPETIAVAEPATVTPAEKAKGRRG